MAVVYVNETLFETANAIASQHVKRGWFEGATGRLVRHIRLRTAVYNALQTAALQAVEAGRTALQNETDQRATSPLSKGGEHG